MNKANPFRNEVALIAKQVSLLPVFLKTFPKPFKQQLNSVIFAPSKMEVNLLTNSPNKSR
jgi:hypothetical protein